MSTCRICSKEYTKARMEQVVCSIACARRIPVIAKNTKKAERKADKQRKESLKTRSEWMADAQKEVNRYVRLRDVHFGCISCGAAPEQKFGGAMDCGHYLSRGAFPHLRFHLHNMASQCVKDNRYLGGLAPKFRIGLVERIGIDKVEALESMNKPAKFSIEYLKRLKSVFAKKANRLEKRRELQD